MKRQLDKDKFILIIGHGRSGTTLCAGLLNQSPYINIAYEYNNQLLKHDLFVAEGNEINDKFLEEEYNGNKIAIHPEIIYEEILECIDEKKLIMHNRFSEFKIIFVKRNSFSTIISRYHRVGKKQGYENTTFEDFIDQYIVSEKIIIQLKNYFMKYYLFEFKNAVINDLNRKALFDYVGVPYWPIYSESFGGARNYQYGSIREENILNSKENYPELVKRIDNRFRLLKFWPWHNKNYRQGIS